MDVDTKWLRGSASDIRYALPVTADGMVSAADELDRLRIRAAELERLVYVPGLRKCAKCGFVLIQSAISAADGSIRADDKPAECANGCGPMWRVSERDAGNEMIDRADKATAENVALRAALGRIAEGQEMSGAYTHIDTVLRYQRIASDALKASP
jgi:hypothetical protein